MDKLLKFISGYLNAANIRAVDPENPIPFVARASEGEFEGQDFIVQVGFDEPTFNMLPYNVLWICFDRESEYSAKLFRRIGHSPSSATPTLKYTWLELTDFSEVFEKAQFYKPVADLDLVDGDGQVDPVMTASTESLGIVKTTETVVEPRAILKSDERLTDEREATEHMHPDRPRTMLKLYEYSVPVFEEDGVTPVMDETTNTQVQELKRAYLRVDNAFPPTDGCVLFIKSKDEDNEHVWNAAWRKVNASDIEQLGPDILDIEIVKPSNVFGDNQSYTFTAELLMSDGADKVPASGAIWTVSDNSQGITIDPDTGVLSIPDLDADTPLTVRVSYTKDGREFTDFVEIVITDSYVPVTPTGLEIEGKERVPETETANYTVKLVMSDGTKTEITPDSFVSNIEAAAIITTEGVLTSFDVENDTRVTLTAQYTHEGTPLTKTKEVVIVDAQSVNGFEINGLSSIDELTTEEYQCFVLYGDGTNLLISPDTFTLETGSDHATLDGMRLTGNDVVKNQKVTLKATATHKGVSLEATKEVTIVDLDKYAQSLHVDFSPSMDEETSSDIVVRVVYDDGSKGQPLTADQLTISSSDDRVISVSGLTLTAKTVVANDSATISVAHVTEGKTLTEDCYIDVLNTTATQTGIEISGSGTVDEMGTVDLTIKRVYDDGSRVNENDFSGYTFTVSDDTLATVEVKAVPKITVTSIKPVTANTPLTVTATHVEFGSDTHALSIRDTGTTSVDWNVVGTAEFYAGDTNQVHEYRVQTREDDNSTKYADALDWRITTGSSYIALANNVDGKIDVKIKDKDLTADVTATIEAQFKLPSEDAPTWKSFVITIKPLPVSELTMTLFGDQRVNEGSTTSNFIAKVAYKSLWTESVNLTSLEISGEAHGAIVQGSRITAPTDLTADQRISVIGNFDWKGTSYQSPQRTLTLVNSIADYASSKFKGVASQYDAGAVINPTVIEVTMSDGSKQDAPLATFNVTNGAAAVDVTGSGDQLRVTVKPDLADDTQVTMTGTVLVDGNSHAVTNKTFTAKKRQAGGDYPYRSGVVMTPCDLFPTAYRDNLGLVMEYFKSDKNAVEITEADINAGFKNVDIDAFGYPGHDPDDMPWNGMIIVAKSLASNQPRIRDRDTNFEGGWDSAAWTNFVPPDASNSIDPSGQQMGPVSVTFEGEDYWVFKSDWPMLDYLTKIKIEF